MFDPQVCFVCLSLCTVFGVGWAALYWLDDFTHKRQPAQHSQDRPPPGSAPLE